MFTHIEATVPVTTSHETPVYPADLSVQLDSGQVTLEFVNEPWAYDLVKKIRENNLLMVGVQTVPLRRVGQRFGVSALKMIDTLEKQGVPRGHAEQWIREILMEAGR